MNTFFITGEQRSGTTLLSVILGRHSKVLVGEDAIGFRLVSCFGLLEKVFPFNAHHSVDEVLDWLVKIDYKGRLAEFIDVENIKNYPDLRSLVKASTEKLLNEKEKQVWGDKVPNMQHHIGDLLKLIPEARIIHIVRDGRAVAASKLKRTYRNPLVSGQDWVDGNAKGIANQKLIGEEQYKIIRYEDLLTKPDDVLKEVCEFLSIEYEENMTLADSQTEAKESYVKSTLDATKIDSFKEDFKPSTLRRLEKIQAPLLNYFGYELTTNPKEITYEPLSVAGRIWLNFLDNFKSLFRTERVGMRSRKSVQIKIPFKERVKRLFYVLVSDLFSKEIFLRISRRKHIRNIYMDNDLKAKK